MRHFIAIVLIATLVLPTFAPWLPGHVLQAWHDRHEASHQVIADHHQDQDWHHKDSATGEDHAVHLDILTYFDNLHVDLKNRDYQKFTAPSFDVQDVHHIAAAAIWLSPHIPPIEKQSQGPPKYYNSYFSSSREPVYLATQRLRI